MPVEANPIKAPNMKFWNDNPVTIRFEMPPTNARIAGISSFGMNLNNDACLNMYPKIRHAITTTGTKYEVYALKSIFYASSVADTPAEILSNIAFA